MSSSVPSIAELRAVTQPDSVMSRASAEHWAGRLYMRRLSPHLTRVLLASGISANGVTWLMVPTGLLAALSLSAPGLAGAVGAFVLVQFQILLDCCDGEVARWRRTRSPVGIYLDRFAHQVTDASLAIALGVRAAGGWGPLDRWTTLGCLIAVLGLLVKCETLLVPVARATAGRPLAADTARVAAPRPGLLRGIRRAVRFVPFYRALVTMELTMLALAAAIVDTAAGSHVGTRGLVIGLVPVAAVIALGHLVGILSSARLR
jgi:phosphatidylglycerophosphate synthase